MLDAKLAFVWSVSNADRTRQDHWRKEVLMVVVAVCGVETPSEAALTLPITLAIN